jgi:hypothetical protein
MFVRVSFRTRYKNIGAYNKRSAHADSSVRQRTRLEPGIDATRVGRVEDSLCSGKRNVFTVEGALYP